MQDHPPDYLRAVQMQHIGICFIQCSLCVSTAILLLSTQEQEAGSVLTLGLLSVPRLLWSAISSFSTIFQP